MILKKTALSILAVSALTVSLNAREQIKNVTNQGSQYIIDNSIIISMDGKGRANARGT